MNENLKSLVVTAVVILTAAGMITAMLARAKRQARVAPAHTTRVVAEPARPPAQPTRPATRSAARSQHEDRRADFAKSMERRLRDQGRGITVKAVALGRRTLEINWTVKADRKHIESLKRAKPLHEQLISLGFNKLMFKVRERQVYLSDIKSPH